MVCNELKMKSDDRSTDNENIFVSVLVDLSVENKPSVSSNIASTSSFTGIGWFHIQIPFVHACVVDPISNPRFLSMMSLLVQQPVAKEGFPRPIWTCYGDDADRFLVQRLK